jgi:hypothetical protein
MATGNRTLKLSILADVDELKKSLKTGEVEVQGFGDKISDFGKKAGLVFAAAAAAAGAYATKLAIDGVKSALADEQAQLRLADALRAATGATDAQIKATEDYISQTSLAVGIADDDLRPAFQRLSVATGDVTKSQDLLNLAIDISKGTGKDLGAVTEALSKAYAGQDTQLARLGIGITAAEAKTLDFRGETQKLSDLYGGAASRNAETFQGRIDRLKIGFDEAKEAIGFALLPIIERLIGYIFTYGVPIIEKFKNAFDIIKEALDKNKETFTEFWLLMRDKVFPIVQTVFGFMLDVGAKAAAAIINAFGAIVGAITPVLNFIIDAINAVIKGLNLVKTGPDIQQINKIGSGAGVTGGAGGGSNVGGFTGGTGGTGGGSSKSTAGAATTSKLTGGNTISELQRLAKQQAEIQARLDVQNAIIFANAQPDEDQLRAQRLAAITLAAMKAEDPAAFSNTTNIYVSGAVVDPEGLNRVITDIQTQSASRGTVYTPFVP